jgi:hypothetical protein
MNTRFFIIFIVVVFFSACVKAPVYKSDNYARIESSHAIVSINGKQVTPAYSLDLPVGDNTLVALYLTYSYKYYCQFAWKTTSRTTYEITDHGNKCPLTLYRWKKANDLWAERLDPVDPVKCTREKK